MRYVKHIKFENLIFVYEYDFIIEYKPDGHIFKQYRENEVKYRKR